MFVLYPTGVVRLYLYKLLEEYIENSKNYSYESSFVCRTPHGKILYGTRVYISTEGERSMVVSRSTRDRPQTYFWRRVFGQLSRYDLLLAAIPLVFALALAVYALASIPLEAALASGGMLSTVALVDAFYVNPPTGSSTDTDSTHRQNLD